MKNYLLVICLGIVQNCFSQNDFSEFDKESSYYPACQNGEWYFKNIIDSTKTQTTFYDTIHFCNFFYKTNFLAIKGNKFELLDQNLIKIASGNLSKFVLNQNNLFLKWKNEWTRVNLNNKSISIITADSIVSIKDLNYVFHENKTGLVTGDIYIPPIYTRISPFNDGFHINTPRNTQINWMAQYKSEPQQNFLVFTEGKFGLINQMGKVILEPIASIVQYEDYNIIKYKEGNWKYLFPDGKVIDPKGCEIHFYSKDFYKIYNASRDKSTLFEKHKVVKVSSLYDDFFPLDNSLDIAVRKNGKIGLISASFKLLISPFCDQLEAINDNYYKFLVGDKWGLFDPEFKKILPANYANIISVHDTPNGLQFMIAENGKVGIIDLAQNKILETEFLAIQEEGSGYVVMKGNLLGYFNFKGKEILPIEYSSYDNGFQYEWERSIPPLLFFERHHKMTFVNNSCEILNKQECIDFQYTGNVLKCYYDDRIEVLVLKDGNIVESDVYSNIERIDVGHKRIHRYFSLTAHYVSTLELNQLTGLFGARKILSSGLAFPPTYSHCRSTFFSNDWFEAAVIKDTSVLFDFNGFPTLKAYDIYNWMNCDNGKFHDEITLAVDAFKRSYNSSGSDDFFMLIEDEKMNWITPVNRDKLDPSISAKGLLFDQKIGDNYQKVCIGGHIKFVPIHEAEMSMLDYYNYLNQGNNLWFSNPTTTSLIMNPCLGVKFENTEYGIRDTREISRSSFLYEVENIFESSSWNIWSFKEAGESTWNLTNDLNFKSEFIQELTSFELPEDPTIEYIIIGKNQKSTGLKKKGIVTTNLKTVADAIYDDIIYAGSLGFLVRIGNEYYYLNEEGNKLW